MQRYIGLCTLTSNAPIERRESKDEDVYLDSPLSGPATKSGGGGGKGLSGRPIKTKKTFLRLLLALEL